MRRIVAAAPMFGVRACEGLIWRELRIYVTQPSNLGTAQAVAPKVGKARCGQCST